MADTINMTVITQPDVSVTVTPQPDVVQSITGFGIKGDPGTTSWAGITDKPNSFMPSVHTHTAANVTDFDTEVSNNTDVAANTTARHTHANKTLLDTYSQTEVNLADAVAKKHTHANSAVLNDTTASFTTADETKLDGIATGAQVNTVTSVNTRTGAVTGLAEASDLTAHTGNTSNPHSVTKAQVGLGNVDNTADANKPVSTATQMALDGKFTQRTITGTANQVTVTNGDGVSGNPTLSLPSAITTPGSLTITGHNSPQADSTYTLGTSSLYWSNTYTDRLYLNSTAYLDGANAGVITGTGVITADNLKRGTGFPNGVVTANVGSIYIDTAVTNGASSWIKKSGTGNTGWQVLEGDTGWRNVSSLRDIFWSSGTLQVRRVGQQVYFRCWNVTVAGSPTGLRTAGRTLLTTGLFPTGFRYASSWGTSTAWIGSVVLANRNGRVSTGNSYEDLSASIPNGEATPGSWTAGDIVSGQFSYITTDSWPTTLPGTAA